MINDILEQVLEISAQIVDYAKSILDYPVGANMVFTLADHINFAIQRAKNNLQIQLPILYDVEHLFEKEMQIGKNARELIHKKAIADAIGDGCQVMGYTPWGCIDLVSCGDCQMTKRYGFVYVDADDEGNGTYDRYRKDSFYWYQKVIQSNGEDLE